MQFTPNGKRLLVKTTEEEQKTSGGFIIPTKERGDLVTAKVITVGVDFDETRLNTSVLVGRTAFFKESEGVKITIEGENYLIVDDEKVLGFL
jgi:chaperonin GroES